MSPDKDEYFTSGVLCRDRIWKFYFNLLKNGSRKDFVSVGINFIGKNIQKSNYWHEICSLYNKIAVKEFYGVCYGKLQSNLNVIKAHPNQGTYMPIAECPIEVILDQKKGTLTFKTQFYEYSTDKLLPDEEYRMVIFMGYENVEMDCKFIKWRGEKWLNDMIWFDISKIYNLTIF